MFANPISKIFVVVLVVGVALLTVSFASRPPAADRSYDTIEQLRSQAGAAPDTSYDALEGMRVQEHVGGNSTASDYDLVEVLRIHSSFTMPANPYLDYRRGEWGGH